MGHASVGLTGVHAASKRRLLSARPYVFLLLERAAKDVWRPARCAKGVGRRNRRVRQGRKHLVLRRARVGLRREGHGTVVVVLQRAAEIDYGPGR